MVNGDWLVVYKYYSDFYWLWEEYNYSSLVPRLLPLMLVKRKRKEPGDEVAITAHN